MSDEKTRKDVWSRDSVDKGSEWSGEVSSVRGVDHVAGNLKRVAIDGRIEESINLSCEEARSSVRTSREIVPLGVGENRDG